MASEGNGSYQEVYSIHLPSQTTLYSGAQETTGLSDGQLVHTSKDGHRTARVVSRLAAAEQAIEVGAISYERLHRVDYDCYEDSLPRGPLHQQRNRQDDAENGQLTCVAHSSLPLPNRKGSTAVEAFVLRRINSSDRSPSGNSVSDNRGAVMEPPSQSGTATAGVVGSEADRPKQHRRNVSGSATSIKAVDSIDSINIDGESPLSKERAILVVNGLEIGHASSDSMITTACEIPLNYLPLAVRVTNIVEKDGDGSENIGIFVGSAEDTRLRLYMPRKEHVIGGVSVALHEVPFSLSLLSTSDVTDKERSKSTLTFSSPIMAIDCLCMKQSNDGSSETKEAFINYLALGCQDGTIRVASFTCERAFNGHAFTAVGNTDLVVDGPIVTLDLSVRLPKYPTTRDQDVTNHPRVDLVVGSLCGFVCAFHQVSGADQPFEGPEEVVSNLYCGRLGAEDGVLCVKSVACCGIQTGYAIAVGTYSGRVLVFEPILEASASTTGSGTDEAEAITTAAVVGYRIYWSCHLPYPVHGISAADVDGDGMAELLVTTRRSLHIFQASVDDAVEAAKKRIVDLCK
mmetsp:Transcript_35616/g.72218  ORF Transcript_35616/g.72218 Transcript_35616/m.72218 type:complete len:572 (+) Transcript_35616:95-1810(+)